MRMFNIIFNECEIIFLIYLLMPSIIELYTLIKQ